MARVTRGPRISSGVDLSIGGKSYTSGQVSQSKAGVVNKNTVNNPSATITIPVSPTQSAQIKEEMSRWGVTDRVATGTQIESSKIAHTYSLVSPSVSGGVRTDSEIMQDFICKNNQEYYDNKSRAAHMQYESGIISSKRIESPVVEPIPSSYYNPQSQMDYMRTEWQRMGRTDSFMTGSYVQAQTLDRNNSHMVSPETIRTATESSYRNVLNNNVGGVYKRLETDQSSYGGYQPYQPTNPPRSTAHTVGNANTDRIRINQPVSVSPLQSRENSSFAGYGASVIQRSPTSFVREVNPVGTKINQSIPSSVQTREQITSIRTDLNRYGRTENFSTGTYIQSQIMERNLSHSVQQNEIKTVVNPSRTNNIRVNGIPGAIILGDNTMTRTSTQAEGARLAVGNNGSERYTHKGNEVGVFEKRNAGEGRSSFGGGANAGESRRTERHTGGERRSEGTGAGVSRESGHRYDEYNRSESRGGERYHYNSSWNKKPVVNYSYRANPQGRIHTLAEMSHREYLRGVRTTVSFTVGGEARLALNKLKNNFTGSPDFISGGTFALDKFKGTMSESDDVGTKTAESVVATASTGLSAYKLAQTAGVDAVKTGVETVKKVATGTYEVVVAGQKMVITLARTRQTLFYKQPFPLSKEVFETFKQQARLSGLTGTKLAQGIVHRVDAIKTGFDKARNFGARTISTTKNVIKTGAAGVKVVWGVTTGRMSVVTGAERFVAFKNRIVPGLKIFTRTGLRATGGFVVRGTAKTASMAVFRGVPVGVKTAKRGVVSAGSALMATDNLGTQALGATIVGTDIGIKTAVASTKVGVGAVKTTVKGARFVGGGVKTAVKTTTKAIDIARRHGARALWEHAKVGFQKAFRTAAKSVISLVLNAGKLLFAKVALPLAIIVAVIVGLVAVINVPTTFVSTVFTGAFSDGGTQTDVRTYLTTNVPVYATAYKQDLANRMQADKSNYDIIRFYSNTGSGDVVEPTLAGVSQVFPTDEEIINMLHPMYNSLIMLKYKFEPTSAQAKNLVKDLIEGNRNHKGLFRIVTQASPIDIPVEFCGQSLATGEGTPVRHSCGEVHALDDCPNFISGTHTRYTCSDCCRLYCPGHPACDGHPYCKYGGTHTVCSGHYNEAGVFYICEGCITYSCNDCAKSYHNPGCYTKYCDVPCTFECSGYKYCNSHSVKTYTLTLDGAYALEQEYFAKRKNELLNIDPRNDEQEKELQDIISAHSIYQELMRHVAEEYGSGMSSSDLSGVQFVNGSRVGNQSVVDLALSQVGQQGGQPYWSYYGFASRVEWCACFVHWAMRNTPSATAAYPTTANNAYCPTIAGNFQSMGQWGSRGYTDLVAGDTIFFDWEGDGTTDHIGIVIGHDGTYVYTVEGNSMDAVAIRQYDLNSSVIFGYGLMNY